MIHYYMDFLCLFCNDERFFFGQFCMQNSIFHINNTRNCQSHPWIILHFEFKSRRCVAIKISHFLKNETSHIGSSFFVLFREFSFQKFTVKFDRNDVYSKKKCKNSYKIKLNWISHWPMTMNYRLVIRPQRNPN